MEQRFDGRDLLAEPRELFRKFEAAMEYPEGLNHLSEALSLLADIVADDSSAALKQTCSTMVSTYALRVQAKVQPLLTWSPVQQETLTHWHRIFTELEGSGFVLPAPVTACSGNLLFKRFFGETLDEMSPARLEEVAQFMTRLWENSQTKRVQDRDGKS